MNTICAVIVVLMALLAGGTVLHVRYHGIAKASASLESDIESIRAAQRECLDRVPAHSFSLVQQPGGYAVSCNPIVQEEIACLNESALFHFPQILRL